MKNKIFLTVIFFLALSLSGCAFINFLPQQNTADKNGHDFGAIKNPQKMTHKTLSVYIPGDWQEQKQGMFLFYLPPGSIATNTVAEKVVISVYSLPKNSTTTLAEFMKEDFANNQKGIPGLQFVTSTEPVKVGPLLGREEKYVNQIIGKRISITQINAVSGDILYKLQHYCVENSCQYDAIFAEMAARFEIIPQDSTGQ
ncbi:MAG: hypothetical protein PHE24_00225 [Patescibacteria group bacterium]|nr:hypothetical protein [Patescibacteria group bacterium]